MATQVFTIKRGDTDPPLAAILRDSTGAAIDLSGATVAFQMKLREHLDNDTVAMKVNAAATVVDAPTGSVQYEWGSSDTDVTGDYVGEFVVTASGGEIRTVPNPSFITINVVGDIR